MRSIPSSPASADSARSAPVKIPRFNIPKFADFETSIAQHGAIGDGKSDCTAAIAAAIAACEQAGGGRVVVPPGQWFTGPVHLRSGVNLHLAEGAILRFSSDPSLYLPPVFVRWGGLECYNYSPLIYARNCRDVAITGRGVVMGGGRPWWDWHKPEQQAKARLHQMASQGVPVSQRRFGSPQAPLRPQLILAIDCVNVLLEDFTIAEGGPLWNVHAAYCRNVVIRRLRIETAGGPNSDGIDIDSCRNVLIADCEISTASDCVSLKSGLNEDGWRVNKPTENVIIRGLRATAGHSGLAIGSDMSGSIRNVLASNCRFVGTEVGIKLKAARGRGGIVENVFLQNIEMDRIGGDAIQLTTRYPSFANSEGKVPTFRNIRISNVNCQQAQTAVRMIGLPDRAIQNVVLQDVTICAEQGLQCEAGNGIHLVNVRIKPQNGPMFSVKDSQEVVIDGLSGASESGVFLDLRGRQTKNIRLRGQASQKIRPAIVLGIDVPRDAVVHE